ncbi:uncharacterized protein [Pleurodeles waltl]|uniref:uncharacterized protein n=1 Tax=Pleurodeles waltl TaxID=8319 RepID=UPI00370981B4
MAQQDDYYGEYTEGHHVEERLVEALDYHVQDSVNKALVKALRPFAQPIFNFVRMRFGTGSGNPTPNGVEINEPGRSDLYPFEHTINSVSNDHEYGAFFDQGSDPMAQSRRSSSDTSSISDSEDKSSSDKRKGKRKCKKRHYDNSDLSPPPAKYLLFDPDNIIHPKSTEWTPCPEMAAYVQSRLRKSFEKDIHSTLRSECPRPSLEGKVAETPKSDPHMITFFKKFSKDPKKSIDRAWCGCQDTLLDISGPLTKILGLAIQAKESQEPIDPDTLLEWAQRAISLLANANRSMSTERRKSFLIRIDPKLTELASVDAGLAAKGLLFGNRFIKDLAKYVATFSALDNAQTSIKKVFNSGRFRGRSSGSFASQTSRPYQRNLGESTHQSNPNFYPNRSRGYKGRNPRGPRRGGYYRQNTHQAAFHKYTIRRGTLLGHISPLL